MGDIKNLDRQDAIRKMKEMAENIRVCMFCTEVKSMPFETRPMALQKVDEQGNFWFLSGKESGKNREIGHDHQVQLLFGKPDSSDFLSVAGRAEVSRDRRLIEETWNPIAKAWFPEGKDDPDLTVICVHPEESYYWDTRHGRMVSLLKIATAALTGNTMDDGIEGRLKI